MNKSENEMKHGGMSFGGRGGTVDAILRVTKKCNQACVFCCQEGHDWKGDPTLEEIKADILDVKKRGVRVLTFMQAESLMRPDFTEIVGFARSEGIEIFNVATNGTLLSKRTYLEQLVDAGLNVLEFSLHSHIESTANLISRRSFTYRRQWGAIRNIASLKNRPVLMFNTVICRHNHEQLPGLAESLLEYFPDGSFMMNIKYPMIIGRASKFKESIVPYQELDLSAFLAFVRKKRIRVSFDHIMPCILPGFEHRIIKTMDMVLQHNYISREPGGISLGDMNEFSQESKYAPECGECSLVSICAGVHPGYYYGFGGVPARPSKVPVESVTDKIFSEDAAK